VGGSLGNYVSVSHNGFISGRYTLLNPESVPVSMH
jgi:hypothetical protein